MPERPTSEALERRIRELEKDAAEREQKLLEALPVGLSISSPEGVVSYINAAGRRMFGYSSKEAFLKTPAVDHYANPRDRKRFKVLHKQGIAEGFEAQFVRKDGTTFWAAVSSLPRPAPDGGIHYLNIFTDISERKAAAERAGHLDRALRAIRMVNRLITREADPDRLLQGICDGLVENRGYYNAWIALLDEEDGLKGSAEAGLGDDFIPLLHRMEEGRLPACGQKALSKAGMVAIPAPNLSCLDCPLASSYGERGALTIRLESEGRVYGLLSASIPSRLIEDAEKHSLFKEMAGDVAFAVRAANESERRKAAEKALRGANRSLEWRIGCARFCFPGNEPG